MPATRAKRNPGGFSKVVAGIIVGPLQMVFASTAAGKAVLFAFIVGVFVAVKTGSNQVMLTVALMLGLLVADSLANFLSMRRIRMTFGTLPEEIWAGEATVLPLDIENAKKVIPAGNMSIDVSFEGPAARNVHSRGTLGYAGAGRTETVDVKALFPQRGMVNYADVRCRSAFPMGLLVDRVKKRLALNMVVYPQLGTIAPGFLRELGGRTEHSHRTVPNMPFGDTMGLREYRPGDSLRKVSWRASAHRGKLVVREFEQPRHTDLIIALDSYIPSPARRKDLEWLISFAASLSIYAAASGWHLKFMTACPKGAGRYEVDGINRLGSVLRCLAVIESSRLDRSEMLVRTSRAPGEERVPMVLLTLAPQPAYPGNIVAVNPNTSPEVFTLEKDA